MSSNTAISWTDATWNPTRGCRRISAGCEHCYAERQANRFKGPGKAYEGLVKLVSGKPRWTGATHFAVEQLAQPLSWREPRRIFVDSMSDLFYEGFSNEEIAAVFGVMAAAPQHTFQILTKRAKRMREWFAWARERAFEDGESVLDYGLMLSGFAGDELGDGSLDDGQRQHERMQDLINDAWARTGPDGGTVWDTPWPLPNVWLGASVENQAAADERIPELLATPAAIRFLSCEPLIGPVSLAMPNTWLVGATARKMLRDLGAKGPVPQHLQPPPSLDWVIAGCESGPGARPCSVEWLRSLRDQCASAGVAFFLKQAVDGGSTVFDVDSQGRAYGITCGTGAKAKGGSVIERPYLDNVQHLAFPTVTP